MKGAGISNFTFCIIYTIYSFCLFNVPLFNRFISILQPRNIYDILFLVNAFIVVSVLCFNFYSILFQKYFTKLFACAFLIINSVIFSFLHFYGVPFDEEMLGNILKTNVYEALELFSSLKIFLFIFLLGILPSILIFYTKITEFKIIQKVKILVYSILLCAALISLSYIKFVTFFRVHNDFEDYLIPFNYLLPTFAAIKERIFPMEQVESTKIHDIKIKDLEKDLTVVLIVGETARKKNLSLYGYERETNPMLSLQKKLIVVPDTLSCGTSTAVSIPCIFKISKSTESFLFPLQRAGVKVKWYENNYGGCYGACDEIEVFKTDHSKCDGSCFDSIIFEQFFKDLHKYKKKHGKKLFVLHQNGSHGPLYYKRYPREFARFKPECLSSLVTQCADDGLSLQNSYDNTILYTDFLINQTIEELKRLNKPSILIYISDHGESLGEYGIFLHGFPYKIAPDVQKEIPFLIWASHDNIILKTKPGYHHRNIVHTILAIMEAKTEGYSEEENIISFKER